MIILLGWRKSISGFPSGRAEPRWGEQALAAPPALPFPRLLGPARAPRGRQPGAVSLLCWLGRGANSPPGPPTCCRAAVLSWGWMLSAPAATSAAQGCSRGSLLRGRWSSCAASATGTMRRGVLPLQRLPPQHRSRRCYTSSEHGRCMAAHRAMLCGLSTPALRAPGGHGC